MPRAALACVKVRQQGQVLRCLHLSGKGLEEIAHRTGMPAPGLLLLITIDGDTICLQKRVLLAGGALPLPCAQQVAGALFALGYVRLVERIDA